jgi:hypothetical protein
MILGPQRRFYSHLNLVETISARSWMHQACVTRSTTSVNHWELMFFLLLSRSDFTMTPPRTKTRECACVRAQFAYWFRTSDSREFSKFRDFSENRSVFFPSALAMIVDHSYGVGFMEVTRIRALVHRRLCAAVLRSLLLWPPSFTLPTSWNTNRLTNSANCVFSSRVSD